MRTVARHNCVEPCAPQEYSSENSPPPIIIFTRTHHSTMMAREKRWWTWLLALSLAIMSNHVASFTPSCSNRRQTISRLFAKARGRAIDIDPRPSSSNNKQPQGNNEERSKPLKNRVTVSQLKQNFIKNPIVPAANPKKKKKSRRTHRKSEHPQQTYVYAWQKRQNSTNVVVPTVRQLMEGPRQTACDPCPFATPVCREEIALQDGGTAYIVEKPSGWAIIGNHYQKSVVSVDESDKREIPVEQFENNKKLFDQVLGTFQDDILALMTPEELEAEGLDVSLSKKDQIDMDEPIAEIDFFEDDDDNFADQDMTKKEATMEETRTLSPETEGNFRRIQARLTVQPKQSVFATQPIKRPSLTAWLKEHVFETTGKSVRGGTYWKAVAGATTIADSGLVLLAPRSNADELFVESASYLAVGSSTSDECKVITTLRANRNDDILQVMEFDHFVEKASTCDDVESLCENVRGGEDTERKAPRRLIHCQSLAVSTELSFSEVKTEKIPDDIEVYVERGLSSRHGFTKGSFVGRESLRASNHTTAYREINGAADGFPGWTVDRYGQWLVVYHQPEFPQGPLPSIHDGYTTGVYYVEKSQNGQLVRPRLLEGKAAPESFVVMENGINYVVSLHHDFSTGIFLDQRPQRAWLSQQCNNSTRILNTFAHTGAFGVAAAVTGASTVNIDLNRKWLDRFPLHLQANGIEYDERHDCIYGDCFEWLQKLVKRQEKYDIVILDPPSSSIGSHGKRRWSVTADMDELVELAVQLVLPGGYLWTTTNCASLPIAKFAKMAKKGAPHAQLERIQPMPVDFPTVGPQNVKNLVWRIRK